MNTHGFLSLPVEVLTNCFLFPLHSCKRDVHNRLIKVALGTFTHVGNIDLTTSQVHVSFLGAYGFAYFVDSGNPCKCGQVDLSSFIMTETISTGVTGGGCSGGSYDFDTDFVYAL